jgi:hypothetical protein
MVKRKTVRAIGGRKRRRLRRPGGGDFSWLLVSIDLVMSLGGVSGFGWSGIVRSH